MRNDLVRFVVRQGDRLVQRLEPFGIVDRHALGALEKREVTQRGLAERQQLDPDAGRVARRRQGEVRPREPGRGADGRQQVLDQGEVEHLLLADRHQRLAPALDRCELIRGQAFALALFERERGEEVLEHDQMLELRRLAERVDQGLAVLQTDLGTGGLPPACGEHVGERSVRSCRDLVDHAVKELKVIDIRYADK